MSSLPPFPFILSLPQGHLLRFLRERLADVTPVQCMQGCEVIGVQPHSDSVTVTAINVRDGSRLEWTAAYVVACDGRHSFVRRALEVPTLGKTYPVSFLMGDFPDTTSWSDEAHLFFTPDGSVESFPLPRKQRRWVVLADRQSQDRDALIHKVQSITGIRLDPLAEQWHSAFTPERRRARAFFQQRVVLCGDAAHVMSPIGGQGMNTGLADARQLAVLLQRLLSTGEAHGPLFTRYQSDRCRAYRIAANRAARSMWLGTRTGRRFSAIRAGIIRQALGSPTLSHRLARYFAMLDLPNGQDWES